MLISRDGLFWRSAELPAFGRPTGIAALPGQFTIFSTSGYISSAWLGEPELLKSTRAGNGLSLTIRAQTGKPLDLWSSSTLEPALWTRTPFFTPLESYTTRVLAEPFNSTLRVYRIGQSNLAPASITGRTLEVRILTGWGMLASAGSYRFSTSPTGNRYTITPIDGPIMSDAGTYGYSILAMDRARLMLTNQLGWVLKTDIRLESATQGDTSSQLLSTSSGEQFGTFDLK